MSEPAYQDQAQIAAIMETSFDLIAERGKGGPAELNGIPGLDDYTVLEVGSFDRGSDYGGDCYKAITVMDKEGNIYVHFRGTGDGNWPQNSAAYQSEASKVQQWAQEYTDSTLGKYYATDTEFYAEHSDRKIYLSGHSQGGNNAQYAMLTTKYYDSIEACISLDGQNFSHDVANDLRSRDGFSERRDKIYAYNGKYDFVSPLGQERLVRDDHSYLVDKTTGYNTDGKDHGVAEYHMVNYMLNGNGKFEHVTSLTDPNNGESAFRKTIRDLNEQINKLPPEVQSKVADYTMMLAELFMGDDFHDTNIIGKPSAIDANKLLLIIIPALIMTMIEHPEDFQALLSSVLQAITDFATKHPIITIALVLCLPFLVDALLSLGVLVVKIVALLDVLAIAVELGLKALKEVWNFCKTVFETVKNAVQSLKQWARNTFNKGVSYVRDHPSFSCDPDVLERLADRLRNIQTRLMRLDSDMDTLYWQVGFLDLLDILHANLVTGGSPTLFLAECYLRNTATRISNAETQAAAIMGG